MNIVIIILAILVSALIIMWFKNKDSAGTKRKRGFSESTWLTIYDSLKYIPWVSHVQGGFYQLYQSAGHRLDDLKIRSGKITAQLLTLSLMFLLFGIVFAASPVILLCYVVGTVFTFKIMSNKLQLKIYVEDLNNLQKFANKLKSGYGQTKTVTGALDVTRLSGVKHSTTASEMLKLLTSKDSLEALEHYYKTTPNKYLKQILALCHKIMETGDIEEGEHNSVFLTGLNNIVEDIRAEYNDLRRLTNKMEGSSADILFALVLVQPVIWLQPFFKLMDGTANFLEIPIGFWTTVAILLALVYLCIDYVFLTSVSVNTNIVQTEKLFLSKLMEKPFVKEMLHRVAPVHKKNQRSVKIVENTEDKLKKASSVLTVQEFYLQRIIYFAVALILCFALIQVFYVINKDNLIGEGWEKITPKTSEDYMMKSRKEFEYAVFKKFDYDKMTRDEMVAYISATAEFKPFVNGDVGEYTDSLVSKYDRYSKSSTRWYDLIISSIVAFLCSLIPGYLLDKRAKNREWEVQNEVEGFITVVSVMSRMPSTQVLEILVWMERYAVIFKESITSAINSYNRHPKDSLALLEMEIRNDTMSELVQKLEMAVQDIQMRDAFKDLDTERVFMRESRKIDQEKLIDDKTFFLGKLGQRATAVVFIGLLILPLGVEILPMLAPIQEVMRGGLER